MLVRNQQNLLSLLALFSLIQGIRTDLESVSEEVLYFTETILDDTSIISANTVEDDEQNFDDIYFTKEIEVSSNKEKEKYQMNKPEITVSRKSRDLMKGNPYAMDCFSCFGNTSSKSDENCYEGTNIPVKRCADAEHCFIELNPNFIKRGCILPGRVNRTFACKCPLCNDKPSFDMSHYEYKKVNDWEYDNARLLMPMYGMDLMCKVCETKGTNPTSDKNCRYGKNADYMVCARNQLCYTNIDDEIDFVSRGCINKPIQNSMYFFCNNTECNIEKFPNPAEKLRLRADEIKLKEEPGRKKKIPTVVSRSLMCTCNSYLVCAIILKSIKCI